MKKIIPIIILILAGSFFALQFDGCSREYKYKEKKDSVADPLPGDLVKQSLEEDSVFEQTKGKILQAMTGVIKGYRANMRDSYLTGYFLTDLDSDGMPELWVKTGASSNNSKLELFYPMEDGSLKKSVSYSGPGEFFRGKDYLIQTVQSGPGYIDINHITIRKGEMVVTNERTIDTYANPESKVPKFEEPKIHDNSFANLSPINQALK